MARARLRVVGAPPSGPGLADTVRRLATSGTWLSAFDDAKLAAMRSVVDGEEDEIDLLPFGELVARLLNMAGEPVGRMVSRPAMRAILEVSASELPEDSTMRAALRHPGTVERTVDALTELRDWGYEPASLAACDHPLAQDLARLARNVERQFGEVNRETAADRVRRALESTLPEHRVVRHVLVLAGGEEKPLFERWLDWLPEQGVAVTVVVEDAGPDSPLFAPSRRLAQRLGSQIERTSKPAWWNALFTDEVVPGGPMVEIVSAGDPLAESEWTVRDCWADRPRDPTFEGIAMFMRDAQTYVPLARAAALRLGDLPSRFAMPVPLLSTGLAETLLRVLRTLGGTDVREVERLARMSGLRLGSSARSALRAACRQAYETRGSSWEALQQWAEQSSEAVPWLAPLCKWREAAEAEPALLREWSERLTSLVGGSGLLRADAQDPTIRLLDDRAGVALQTALQHYGFFQDRANPRPRGLAEFVSLAERLWEPETAFVRGERAGVHWVTSTGALEAYHTVHALGMLEGAFPRRRTEHPVLSDTLRRALSEANPHLPPLLDSHETARQERDELARLCASVTHRLVLRYPQTDDERDNVPTLYLDEVERAAGGALRQDIPRTRWTPAPEACRVQRDLDVAQALAGEPVDEDPPVLLDERARSILRKELSQGVSPDEFADALECSFRSAAAHRLRLPQPRRWRLEGLLLQVPQRARLVAAADPERAGAALDEAANQILSDHFGELDPWEIELLDAALRRLKPIWLDQEFRARQKWPRTTPVVNVQSGQGMRHEAGKLPFPFVPGRTVPALYTSRHCSTALLYQSSPPSLDEYQSEDALARQFVRLGLYMLMLEPSRREQELHGTAVEVDAGRRGRVFVTVPNVPKNDDVTRNLKTLCLGESRSDFFRDLMGKLVESAAVIQRADMNPTPGPWCARCSFGDLCRWADRAAEVR